MFRTVTRYILWMLAGHNHVPGQFLFLHIAKTAGTSFTSVIEVQFAPWRINRAYEPTAFMAEAQRRLGRFRLIRGHFAYNMIDLFPSPPHVIVMLREPMARTLSHLRHMQREPKFCLHGELPLAQMTPGEMLADERVVQVVRDYQTRVLGHDMDPAETSLQTMEGVPAADSAMLERAIMRLESCEFVGLTEQFEASVELLCGTFNWRPCFTMPYLNVTPQAWAPHEITPEVRARVAELTAYDARLYGHAQNVFEQRLAELETKPADQR